MSLKSSNVNAFLFGVVGAIIAALVLGFVFYAAVNEMSVEQEAPAMASNEELEKAAYEKIRIVEPQLTLNQVRASDLYPGLVEVYHDGKLRYVLGDLVVRGDLIDIDTGENLTQKTVKALRALHEGAGGGSSNVAGEPAELGPVTQQTSPPVQASEQAPKSATDTKPRALDGGGLSAALAMLANDIIPDEMTVVYPSTSEEKHQVTIFSDITCPVCKKNHEDYAEFQAQGITIRAALFPRRGMDAPEAEIMTKVMCAPTMEERRSLLDKAYTGDPLEEAAMCDNGYLQNIRDIAIAQDNGLGVQSTPTLMFDNGLRVDGYPRANPVSTIMRMLEEQRM